MSGSLPKYNEKLHAKLVDTIELGLSRTDACNRCRIDIRTLVNWLNRYPELKADILEAESRVIEGAIKTLVGAAGTDWKAALALLYARRPAEYCPGRKVEVDIQVSDNTVRTGRLSMAELKQLKAITSKTMLPEITEQHEDAEFTTDEDEE